MSELEVIQSTLERAARRRRWQRAWAGLWRGVFLAALIWLLSVVVYKLVPIPESVLLGTAIAGGIVVLAFFLWGWIHKPSMKQTALWVDSHQQLHERLSTALEMANGGNENWRALLISDAARFASQVDPRKLAPIRLPQVSRWALLVLALAAGLGFVPEYRTQAYIEKKQDAQAIKDAGKKLVELTKQNLEHRPPVLEPTRKALESVEQMGMQLASNSVTRSEALKDIASASEKVKSELRQISPPTLKALERAARTSNSQQGAQPDADLQKKIDQLQKEMGKAVDSDALSKLKNDLRKAQQAAANLPDAKSPEGAAAREQLSKNLASMAQQAKSMEHEIPGLDEAIAALKENRTDDFVKDLDAATTDLDKLQQMNQAMQQLQQQAEAGPGKDLAEQLKNGQTDLAQGSLQKMMDQLKSPGLTSEKMKQMLDEVSRSVDPATPFGKAASELKKAAQQMEKGNKEQAAQSLAQASEELQKMAAEMQDAKSLSATLDALKKAETAIATRQGWGQCAYCGDKTGKCLAAGHCLSNGKKPGKNGGVGTWTDDDSKLYPEMSDTWNNEGAQQRDQAAHGAVDRGDPQLADNLAPTKLKGQINPGGPMPSITLKGVSIKGQSGVGYQEAATAAQSAAQSALNQDQVPRAYQGAVRDYFDDLKK